MIDFDDIMKSQEELQKAYGLFPIKDDRDRNEKLKDMMFCLEDELHEAMHEFAWRSWTTSGDMNVHRVKEELRDAFQFFVNCMLILDMTPEELMFMVKDKQQINWHRIKSDYQDRIANEEDAE